MLLTLKTLLPIASGKERGSLNFIHTVDHISGTALRGWTAEQYLSHIGTQQDELFHKIFILEEVSFPNLYPIKERGAWRETHPFPVTARSCKRCKGFIFKGEGHGVTDLLFRFYLAEVQKNSQPVWDKEKCPRCSAALQQTNGFYQRDTDQLSYSLIKASTRVITRTAINRDTLTAQTGMLYSYEVINEGMYFAGSIKTKNEKAKEVLGGLFKKGQNIRIGTAKTRGLGKLQIVSDFIKEEEPVLRERLELFNKEVKNTALKGRYSVENPLFSITLISDTILMDQSHRFLKEVNESVLEREGIFKKDEIRKIWQGYYTKKTFGWNATTCLPKRDGEAVGMGSVFLFEHIGKSYDDLISKLTQLEEHGLGDGYGEGFGRVLVCDPFHWEVQEI